MTQFDSQDQSEKSDSKQDDLNACARALRLDFERNQERSGLSLSSINIIAKSGDATDDANRQLEAKRQLAGTNDDTRYSMGVDFIITALLAVTGITKVRQEMSKEIDKKTLQEEPGKTQSKEQEAPQIHYSMTSSSGYWPNHEQKRSTIIIGKSDCLNRIAQTLYQDPNLGWLIADLNKHRMSERTDGKLRVVSIAALQILDMPLQEEIIHFQETKPNDFCAENLVTIVLQNTIDKNKLEESLAPVVPKLIQD